MAVLTDRSRLRCERCASGFEVKRGDDGVALCALCRIAGWEKP